MGQETFSILVPIVREIIVQITHKPFKHTLQSRFLAQNEVKKKIKDFRDAAIARKLLIFRNKALKPVARSADESSGKITDPQLRDKISNKLSREI